jgi:pantothenate kinase
VSAADSMDELVERAVRLLTPGRRAILGITGSPGAGKTVLAQGLAEAVNRAVPVRDAGPVAVHLPMDGYHLANATLDRLGNHDRKGAIDTFDGWGFVSLLRRLLVELDHTVYAPGFDRSIDEPVAGQVGVEPATQLVIVEGNYLLADLEPWSAVKGMLTESWFCDTSESERLRRLIDRHELHGRSREAATAWARSVDGKNAILIEATRARADLIVSGVTSAVIPAS